MAADFVYLSNNMHNTINILLPAFKNRNGLDNLFFDNRGLTFSFQFCFNLHSIEVCSLKRFMAFDECLRNYVIKLH